MNTLIQRFVAFYAFINNDNQTIRKRKIRRNERIIYKVYIHANTRNIIIKSSYNSYLLMKMKTKEELLKNFTTN